MTGLLLLLFAVVAGSFLPMQAGVNARLAHFVGGPVRASMISFFVGAVVLLIVALLFTRGGAKPSEAPWWAWIGGALGAFYVTSTVVVPVRIGAAAVLRHPRRRAARDERACRPVRLARLRAEGHHAAPGRGRRAADRGRAPRPALLALTALAGTLTAGASRAPR